MVRKSFALSALFCAILGSSAAGSPPTLTLPSSVTGLTGAFITVPATTSGKTVVWYAVDPGLNLFPAQLLKDTRTAVVTSGKPGTYRLLAISAAGDEPSEPIVCTVVIQASPTTAEPPLAAQNPGVFLSNYAPPVCGPDGCSFQRPSTFSFREFRR